MMNSEQVRLARHALGLDGCRRRSYRNRYYISAGSVHGLWMAMVAQGYAETDGDRFFCLTRKGAELVLRSGESLCPEDFPA